MSTTTTNYSFIKPALTDAPPDITAWNSNWDILDAKLPLAANKNIYVSTGGNDTSGSGASGAPYKTITKALSTIPKNLGGFDATIIVAAGTYNETPAINNFVNGRIMLTGAASPTAITVTGFSLINTQYCQFTSNLDITIGTGGIDVHNNAMLIVTSDLIIAGGDYGIKAENGAVASCSGGLTINNTGSGLRSNNGKITVGVITGSNNTNCFYAINGGVIAYTNSANFTGTVKHNTTTGGRIYSGSQNNSPSY